jgi:hypothetical protein
MSEVDVFTSFSRLRLELQFGARLHSGIADPTRRSKEAPAFAAVSAVVTDDSERGKARYMTPPYGLRADGPLMTGGCVGAASGAGIRF